MCGRTALTASPDDLRDALRLDALPPSIPHYNVPPSQPVAVLRKSRGSTGRKIELLRWGLIPNWAKDPRIGHKLALARSETVTTTPAFREAVHRRRCLVVIDGFFEWHRAGRGTQSQPFFIRRADRAPFAVAGVWERWVGRGGEVVDSCAIITQPSRPPVEAIHDRMPIVLERDVWDRWLDPDATEATAFAPMLEPHEPALIAFPVSRRVNDPRHDEPSCIEAEAPAQLSLLAGG